MYTGYGIIAGIALVLVVFSAGCLDTFYARPVQPVVVTPTSLITPSPVNPNAALSPPEMALQLPDLPGDYFLKDRSVVAFDEIPAIDRNLGWWQGYQVEFYRMYLDRDDLTGVTQTIGLYPVENMNKLFLVEKDALLAPDLTVNRYEIPFPLMGDRSIAFRQTSPDDRFKVVTYIVIFTSKNVYEKITMSGSTTDYEVLRNITRIAEERIR